MIGRSFGSYFQQNELSHRCSPSGLCSMYMNDYIQQLYMKKAYTVVCVCARSTENMANIVEETKIKLRSFYNKLMILFTKTLASQTVISS